MFWFVSTNFLLFYKSLSAKPFRDLRHSIFLPFFFFFPTSRLMLLSTRAGGIGINLIGASRMILLDVSFNPAVDRQALFRIYRLGQKRTCRIYRLVADGTMEHAIFKRQIDKIHLSHRVVDEKHCERHYNESDLKELYRYKPELKYVGSSLIEEKEDSGKKVDLTPPLDDDVLGKLFVDETIHSYIGRWCIWKNSTELTKYAIFGSIPLECILSFPISNWQLTESLLIEDDTLARLTDEEKAAIWQKHKELLLAGKRINMNHHGSHISPLDDINTGHLTMQRMASQEMGLTERQYALLDQFKMLDAYNRSDAVSKLGEGCCNFLWAINFWLIDSKTKIYYLLFSSQFIAQVERLFARGNNNVMQW